MVQQYSLWGRTLGSNLDCPVHEMHDSYVNHMNHRPHSQIKANLSNRCPHDTVTGRIISVLPRITLCYTIFTHSTLLHWGSPGKNAGMDSHSFLDPGDLPNLGLLYYRQILYLLSHQGSTYIYMYLFFFKFFSHLDCYIILNTVY